MREKCQAATKARILISCMIPLLNFQTGKLQYEEVDEKLEAKSKCEKYTDKTGKW